MVKKLISYGGQGYNDSPAVGKFEVRATETKQFTRLSEAIAYFDSLDEERFIWDLTHIPELLDGWYYSK